MLADQVLGAGVAGELGHLREEAARPQHGIAALAAHRRHADRAALDGTEGRHQPVEQRRADARHVAQLHDGRVDIGCRARAMPVRTEVLRPSAKSGLVTKRRRDLAGTAFSMAASTSSAMWPSTTTTSTACEASAAFTAWTTSGWPSASASILFGPPMRVERPAASTSTATRGACCGARILAVAVVARLRAARDLGQQAARAHAHDLGAADRQAGGQALQHHVEAVVLGRLGAARQAQHRLAVELGRQQQVAGIDRHAEMDDLAARLLDAGRHHVVAVDDRRGAGDQEDVAALRP